MVAVIKKSHSISRTLNYNEQKLKNKQAECIHAMNYAKEVDQMNFYHKLHRLEHQTLLNERVKTSSVQITLNFHADNKLGREKLREISDSIFMF